MRGFVRLSQEELDSSTPEYLRLLNMAITYRDELEAKAIEEAKNRDQR